MYSNVKEILTSSADAAATFVISTTMLNYDGGSIQVTWSGLDATDGYFDLACSNDGTNYKALSRDPITFTASSGTELFNVFDAYYDSWYMEWQPGGNSSGNITVTSVKKSRR